MASLELRSNCYRVVFRYAGKKYSHSLRTSNRREAEVLLGGVDKTLMRLGQGLVELPPGADIVSFVLTDGVRTHKPKAAEVVTLETLIQRYRDNLPAGTMEENSLQTVLLHMNHFKRILGDGFLPQTLQFHHLQSYVQARSQQNFRGKPISPTTIRKEVTSFSGVWRWGQAMGYVTSSFPNKGLKYPKTDEKPPFQTREEIERQIARGGITEEEQQALWECLFLTLPEIADVLAYAKDHARHAFVYPMFVMAAHTGARRSELIRSRITDFDFASQSVLIHEKKRVKGKRSTRRAPLSPLMLQVFTDWFARHPGGPYTFCHTLQIIRSKKSRTEFGALTRDEANDHFHRTLAGSKWDKLRGWHVFRHSFCSNCAARGVDQRLIDAWVGHQSDEMRKRYRHLIPDHQQHAIRLVFAGDW